MTTVDSKALNRSQLIRALRTSLAMLLVFLAILGMVMISAPGIEIGQVAAFLNRIDPGLILILMTLSLVNYSTRALRWHWFSTGLGLDVSIGKAMHNYIAGFSMGVTPGRIGELIRLWLFRRDLGIAYHKTMPMLIADRMNDLIVLIAICLLAIGYSGTTAPAAVVISSSIVILINLALRYPAPIIAAIDMLFAVTRRGRRLFAVSRRMFRTGQLMYTFRNVSVATLYGFAAWSAECLAFYLLLDEFTAGIPIETASFIYAFSTLVGALSFLPGGLGGFELTAILLLKAQGVDVSMAALAVSMIRITTLWFSVALGGMFLSHLIIRRPAHDG